MPYSFTLHGVPFSSFKAPWMHFRPSFVRARIGCVPFLQLQPKYLLKTNRELPCHSMPSRGIICGASSSERMISEMSERPELSLRKPKRPLGERSRSLARKKEELCAKVEFQIKFRTEYGQMVKIVGSAVPFGAWAIARSPAMKWNEGDVWSVTVNLPVNNIYEYKYVVVDSHGASVIHWQKGNNCVLAIGLTDTDMVVGDNWEGSPGARVTSKGKGISTKEERLLDWAEEVKSMSTDNTALVLEQKRKLESAQKENRLVRQEASRLKSELRVASMTRQAAEQQVKELQQENRRLMSLLGEQQQVHKTVMQEALTILEESEAATSDVDASSSDDEISVSDTSPEPVDSEPAPNVLENGAAFPATKSKRPRRKSNRRQRRQRFSTRSAAVSSQG